MVEKVTEHNMEGLCGCQERGVPGTRVQVRGPSWSLLGRMGAQLGDHWESLEQGSRDKVLSRNLK